MKFVIFALLPLILSIGIIPAISFAEQMDSPRKQMENGVSAKEVVCKSGFTLVIRISGDAACVKPSTAEKLADAGWGTIEKQFTGDLETSDTMLTIEEAQHIAEKAFIYSYPLMENYKTMYGSVVDESSRHYKAPFNVIYNEQRLSTPADNDVVTPNSDTLYSRLWVDLRTEPVVLSINPIEDRYFSFQLIDYYTHNFGYIGTRSTGDQGGNFLLAGPNWTGETPDGIDKVVHSESDINFILGRTQVLDNDDLENTKSIMKDYKLQSLSQYLQQTSPTSAQKIDFIPWSNDKGYSSEFINYFNLILTWTKIHTTEKNLFEEFEKIGVKPGEYVDLESIEPEIKEAIESGVNSGIEKMEQNIPNLGGFENGWTKVNAFGDRDFQGDEFLRRASAANFGLYGNSIEEAYYPAGNYDKDQILLDASQNDYVIKFSGEPPVGAFWSVTMYDAGTKALVENSLDRWLLNSSSDLQKNEDNSFELYLQNESPGGDQESNWLPSPDGQFYVILRLYLPDQELVDGTWELPLIEKIPIE